MLFVLYMFEGKMRLRILSYHVTYASCSLLLPAALAAAETKKFATKDTRFYQKVAHVCGKFHKWL